MQQVLVEIKGILGQQADEADTRMITFIAQNGKMVSSSTIRWKCLGTLLQARNPHSQQNVRRRIREGNHRVGRGERRCFRKGDSDSDESQRGFTGEEKQSPVQLKNREEVMEYEIVNEFMKYAGEGMMMVRLKIWIWKTSTRL